MMILNLFQQVEKNNALISVFIFFLLFFCLLNFYCYIFQLSKLNI